MNGAALMFSPDVSADMQALITMQYQLGNQVTVQLRSIATSLASINSALPKTPAHAGLAGAAAAATGGSKRNAQDLVAAVVRFILFCIMF